MMLRLAIRKIWKLLPSGVRLRLSRSANTRFTVSAAAIIRNQRGEFLLLNHLFRPFSGWGIPGGFVKRGESPEGAIRREVGEEIGIELRDLELYRVRTISRHIEVLFAAETDAEPSICSLEISGWGWFDLANLPQEMSEVQKDVLHQAEKNFA